MNKETSLILEHINKNGHCCEKLSQLRSKHRNIKDFQVMLGYLVMEVVSEEKKFMNLSRKNIDLPYLTKVLF